MGIVRQDKSRSTEIEEFRRLMLPCAGVRRSKDRDGARGIHTMTKGDENDDAQEKLVCVTSGVSYIGLAIVNLLLVRGYSVRIVIHNEGDIETLRELEINGEVEVVMAKLNDSEGLMEAFEGCGGVFHTSAFIDPAGLSGYSKSMVEIEVRATENVMEACAITPSVRKCVLTSSLLACTWQDFNYTHNNGSLVIDHDSWSNESLCLDKKLWYALGKLRSERAAWRVAEERGLKLATICPALITGPRFFHRNSTSTIAYLKGAQEMYAKGVLATVDVKRVAEAHVSVFEGMNKTAFGRHICFDQVIASQDDVEKLELETGMKVNIIAENPSNSSTTRFKLSNMKLCRLLLSRTIRCNSK